MMWLAALTMLLFQGLAICTIGAIIESGMGGGQAMVMAIFEIILGVIIVRGMYRDAQRAH